MEKLSVQKKVDRSPLQIPLLYPDVPVALIARVHKLVLMAPVYFDNKTSAGPIPIVRLWTNASMANVYVVIGVQSIMTVVVAADIV